MSLNFVYDFITGGIAKMQINDTVTENGALAKASTESNCLDLFFKTVRNTPVESLHKMLEDSWQESPIDTLKIIFNLRDCRGGKGERKQFHECLRWLVSAGHADDVACNIQHIPFYGTYKDVFALAGTSLEPLVVDTFAGWLCADRMAMTDSNTKLSISLAGKWAPTEGSALDRKYGLADKIRASVSRQIGKPVSLKAYRKEVLVPLRKQIGIVETAMCQQDWSSIKFENVPSVAMHMYRKAFEKHQDERFKQYLADVAAGKTKINARQVFPNKLVENYLGSWSPEVDEVIEQQWKALITDCKRRFVGFKGALSIVDVSGSMSGEPLNVAVSLGLLLSEIVEGPFHHKLITFSSTPMLFDIPGETLKDKVHAISKMNWDMSTNLEGAFNLILDTAKAFRVPAANMPSILYIFSDMQFDTACNDNNRTNFEVIEQKYAAAGYERPIIVFWNLRGNTISFPIEKTVPKTALVSGFSQNLMELFVDGIVPNPYSILRKAIDSERYSRIKLHDDDITQKLNKISIA